MVCAIEHISSFLIKQYFLLDKQKMVLYSYYPISAIADFWGAVVLMQFATSRGEAARSTRCSMGGSL
jgi:hypothetical protein